MKTEAPAEAGTTATAASLPQGEDRLPYDIIIIGIARAAARAITEDPGFNDREKAFLLGDVSRRTPYGLARDGVWWEFRTWNDGHHPSLDELGTP